MSRTRTAHLEHDRDDIEDASARRAAVNLEHPQPVKEVYKPHGEFFGKFLGVIVLGLGIGMLYYVFKIAFHLFNTPLVDWMGKTGPTGPTVQNISGVGVVVGIKFIFLLLMTLVGSITANRGIQLYFSATGIHFPGLTRR